MESLQSNNTQEQKNAPHDIHVVVPYNIVQINENCNNLFYHVVGPYNIVQINENCNNPFYHGKWEFKNICPQCNTEDGTIVTSPGSHRYISGHPPFNMCQQCKERSNNKTIVNE